MKEKLKKLLMNLIKIALVAWFFTFKNFLVIKIILGFLALMVGLTVVSGVIVLIRFGYRFIKTLIGITKNHIDRNEKTKSNVITKLNYSRKRIDAIEKAHTCEFEDVYVDHYVPVTEEEYNDLMGINEEVNKDQEISISEEEDYEAKIYKALKAKYKKVEEKEREILLENNSEKRNQLKNELIKLSFDLQDYITLNNISMTNYENLEHLYQNYEAAEAYEQVAESLNAHQKGKKYLRFLRK